MHYPCPLMRDGCSDHRGRTCCPCSEQLMVPCGNSVLGFNLKETQLVNMWLVKINIIAFGQVKQQIHLFSLDQQHSSKYDMFCNCLFQISMNVWWESTIVLPSRDVSTHRGPMPVRDRQAMGATQQVLIDVSLASHTTLPPTGVKVCIKYSHFLT